MSINTHFDEDNAVLTIAITGDFDNQIIQSFQATYKESTTTPHDIIIDLKETSYIDSTALGMLVALRDYADSINANVHIKNMNDVVLEIFRVLNFHKLFKPEYDDANYGVCWSYHPEC